LRRPLELGQHTSIDYTQTLVDHRVLASVGSVGEAYVTQLMMAPVALRFAV